MTMNLSCYHVIGPKDMIIKHHYGGTSEGGEVHSVPLGPHTYKEFCAFLIAMEIQTREHLSMMLMCLPLH